MVKNMTLQSSALPAAYSEEGSTLDSAVVTEAERPATVHDLSLDNVPTEAAVAAAPAGAGAQAALPRIQTQSLPEVYEQAGVSTPAHGFSILKIADMLNSAHVRDLALDAKRAAVMMALEASSIQLTEVLEDAARRERALNDYEALQQQTFQNYRAGKQQQNEEIQAEIRRLTEQLQSKMLGNEKELASEKARLDEWRTKKREEERRIRAALSHFGAGHASPQAGSDIPTVPATPQRPQHEAPPIAPIGKKSADPAEHPAATENGGRSSSSRPSLWKRDK
jgi:hypothetical protein